MNTVDIISDRAAHFTDLLSETYYTVIGGYLTGSFHFSSSAVLAIQDKKEVDYRASMSGPV